MKNRILVLLVSSLVFRCFSEVCKDGGYELNGKSLGPFCYDATNVPKGPYSSMALAARQACNEFSNECRVGNEGNVGIYKSSVDGQFYYGFKSWFKNDGSSKHAAPPSVQEYRVGGESFVKVADMHNHPSKMGDINWFSEMDGKAADDVDVIMYDCATKDLFRIDHASKFAYRINADGKEINVKIPPKECFGDGGGACYWPPIVDEPSDSVGNKSVVKEIPFVNSKTKVFGDVNNRDDAESASGKSGLTGMVDNTSTVKTNTVGIKGWCKCLDKQETCGAKSVTVGKGASWTKDSETVYVYKFCLRCGKCRKPDDVMDFVILNSQPEEFNRVFQNSNPTEYLAALKAVQQELMKIPDGQIVVPGKCKCRTPDPINSGYHPEEKVCVACGKYCENPSGKIGSTAMRLMKEGR